ncbi:hypothetical protein B0H21DRAFT_880399 [Amylocystis lapponica]|nr:hypothetical protein B0H21DRAFT_880399 [Amylocystis lapponica]
MPRGYDASSESYSLYSHPVSMTRASSSTQDSEPIATPLDEFTLNRTSKAGERGSRGTGGGKSAAYGDAVRIRSGTPDTSQYPLRDRQVESIPEPTQDLEPYGPYFSLPRDPTGGAAGLTRRRTAKELIGQYESMEAHSTVRRPYSVRPVQKARQETAVSNTEKKDKSRSPIRQSLRNFMSVFKKNKTHSREQSEHLAVPENENGTNTNGGAATAQYSLRVPPVPQLPRLDLTNVKQDIDICTTPLTAHPGLSGPLLYLSRPGSPDIYPVWTSSTAALHSTHILVTWNTAGGNPSPHLIQFTACTDGRPREKFAASRLRREQPGDAILQAQEQRSETMSIARTKSASQSDAAPSASPLTKASSPTIAPSVKTSKVSPIPRLTLDIDRALPAIPASPTPAAPVSPIRFSLKDPGPVQSSRSPVSTLFPLPVPPTTPTSSKFLVPPSPVRPQSPSIPPAALERTSSTASSSASPRACPGLTTPSTPVRSRSPMRSEPGQCSARPARYPAAKDPSSTHMAGVQVPYLPYPWGSRLQNGGEGQSTPMGVPSRAPTMFSAASRYSSDNEVEGLPRIAPLTIRRGISPPRPLGLPGENVRGKWTPDASAQGKSSSLHDAGSSDLRRVLEGIGQSVQALAGCSETSGTDILDIRAKVHAILEAVSRQTASNNASDIDAVAEKLEEMRAELKTMSLQRGSGNEDELRNIGKSGEANPVQLLELHAKVDGLITLCESMQGSGGDATAGGGTSPKTQEILTLLQGAQSQWDAQSTQQADSIRYLNELNSWLEAFVNHGTSHMENVAAGVQQLCKGLGPLEIQPPGEDGEAQPGGLLGEVRRLLAETKSRDDNSVALHTSVNGLLGAVQEDLRRNADTRNVLTTESVAGLIDQQRQDHERMLRDLANELSDEIRGERLRFVEAMKEATAINVQIHVEEFKKELTREVLVMTQEVGRLQRERQTIEQQIADLFAFYAKQKKSGGSTQTARTAPRHNPRQQQPRLHVQVGQTMPGGTMPGMHRRPLPSPVVRPGSAYG